MKSILRSASFKILLLTGITVSFIACKGDKDNADAYGNFETDEVIVSAESQGELIQFGIHEGDIVNKGQFLGRIDSTDVSIKKNQLLAQHSVILARIKNLEAQLRVQDEQRANLVREVNRITNLFNDKAATQQQLDDINGKLKVLDSQTEALKSQKSIITGEQSVLSAQLQEIDNQISKCRIASPAGGTILEKYADAGELVSPGKALFKLADLNEMELKVYISGSQLSSVSIGDTVNVNIDSKSGAMQTIKGVVSWVASQVEFTPKIIQTKQERVNMVYAVKVRVKNDGRLKIGMPGEVRFSMFPK